MKRVVGPGPEGDQQNPQTPEAPSNGGPSASTPPAERPLAERTRPRKQEQTFSPEVMEILVPSLKFGATAGACGLFVGAAGGILQSGPIALFSLVSGVQWFTLGTAFTAARPVSLGYFAEGDPTPRDKVKASTVAGGVAGACGGLLRGPRNIIPATIMFSLFGAGGQTVANWRDARAAKARPKSAEDVGFWAKWSPLKELSDQDYEKILDERLLRVEAEIAVVDDHIKDLREAEAQKEKDEAAKSNGVHSTSSGKA